jgi:molecular chaperone GrpE (heat shock protein)
LSNSPKLLKPNVEVTESELQTELGNLKTENETLKADYAKLLESSTHVINKLRQEVQELRSQGKAKIILEIWGVTKGGSPKYKAAEAEYKRLMQEEGG